MVAANDLRWNDLVIRTTLEKPTDLLFHPDNFRIHSALQQSATENALDELGGWVRHVLCNETTGRIIDGHMRVAIAERRGELVPVDWVSITEEQERIALRSLDELAAAAAIDHDKIIELNAMLTIDKNSDLRRLLDATASLHAGKKGDDILGDIIERQDDTRSDDVRLLPPERESVDLGFSVGADDAKIVRNAIKAAKETFGVDDSGLALVRLCADWLAAREG